MPGKIHKRLFTVNEFLRMVAAGIFPDERLELIEGEIFVTTPVTEGRYGCIRRLNYQLNRSLGARAVVDVHSVVWLNENFSEVYPDVSVLREGTLSDELPKPKDILLAIEVSEFNRDYNADATIPRYGEDGVPETWLIDLRSGTVSVYRQPFPEGYREVQEYRRGDEVSLETFPDVRIPVGSILG